ncbi:arylsulfatase [Nocardioides daejeonensis]|uniref:arylsulfatase n=1 Tax=Nocardioides daejeonensis TaxID=1046556 RepID=UPI000D74E5D8|nr:arylsulfatase [Nocardioides daejeonensis]
MNARQPEGRPNIVVVLLDDVGFGAASTFGGPVHTPTLDRLASRGLRYNRFHTTAICSPTRASLLTGRDAHVTGVGTVLNSAFDHPAYRGVLRDETATVARMLSGAGYSTACIGKWHLAPTWESSQAGPFDRWPTGRGFDHFYGFLGGETHQFEPTLYEGTRPVHRPDRDDYHLTEDLVDKAIEWIRVQRAMTPGRPFFLYLPPGATHAPLHVPAGWREKYAGSFDQGWDAVRTQTWSRQLADGVIPEGTGLTPRPEEIPAWETLSEDERTVAARLMEVYAGFLEHTDTHLGRLVDELEESGQFDNTLFCYVVGDNGSSAEGGPSGALNYMGTLQGLAESTELRRDALDRIGTADSYAQYPAGWAWAMTTPFQWMKQVASHLGGTRNPMVVSWPAGIGGAGEWRSQFGHVNDLAPTFLEVAGVEAPEYVDGVRQLPMDGTSLVPSFSSADADEHHRVQYFEVNGHRSVYRDGWMASAHHGGVPWTVGLPGEQRSFDEDVWELYDLGADFSQAHDVSADHPQLLAELTALFEDEAGRVGILPLQDARIRRPRTLPNLSEGRTSFTFYEGMVGMPEEQAPRLVGRSWHLAARLDAGPEVRGVVATMGGRAAGWSLWIDPERRPVLTYRTFEIDRVEVRGKSLDPGEHLVEVVFAYEGPGFARPATLSLVVDGESAGSARVRATPPAVFSIDETFDIGCTTGSPVGDHPVDFPFRDGRVLRVDLELDG